MGLRPLMCVCRRSAALPQPCPRCTGLVSIGPEQPVQRKAPTDMSTLFIGARHLHVPVLLVLPILQGFLLVEDGAVLKTFSGDRGRGCLRARLDGRQVVSPAEATTP